MGSVTTATQAGRLETLLALRDQLASAIDLMVTGGEEGGALCCDCGGPIFDRDKLPTFVSRMQDVLRDIDSLSSAGGKSRNQSVRDELAARRKARETA